MKREPGIKWLFMDLNSYFASVEQQENPLLRGKPVAVTPMDTDYTCAIAASYEAKLYGIKTGTMIKDAKRMCPNLLCVPARHDRYVLYHNKIIEEVVRHTPINKIWSIDELSSRLPPNKRNINAAKEIAQNIKEGLYKNVGKYVRCSIGFAPNSLLAKIACSMKKPDGLTIITQEELPDCLLNIKLNDLPGIGRNMEKRLHKSGVKNVKDFWDIGPKQARKIWGSVQGERFWYLLHGYDLEMAETKTSMVGHSRILDPDIRSPEKAYLILRKLAAKAATRLSGKEYFTRTIYISVRTKCGVKWHHALNISATQNPFILLVYVDNLWERFIYDVGNHLGYGSFLIKKVSVSYHNLEKKETLTEDLFLTGSSERKIFIQKTDALANALKNLQHKYQKDVVSIGLCPKTSAGYVGTKIAFSRVPDAEEFWS